MITYKINEEIPIDQIIELYKSSGLNRPVDDAKRISRMYAHSNLVISAWDGEVLAGISRSLTDFSFCCYLSDLAVKKELQHLGIGKELVTRTRKEIGPESMLLLLAAPLAIDYYPKIGMEKVQNGFIIHREK